MYQVFEDGRWINKMPTTNGQRYRYIDAAGGVIESFWYQSGEVQE
jgi:hypothetical protein